MNTGEKIKLLREKHNYTLEELGKKIGVGKSTVRKWETGMIANMGRDKIAKLAEVFNVSPTYLISDDSKDPATKGDGLEESIDLSQLSEDRKKLIQDILKASDQDVSFVLQMTERLLSDQ